jgi:hypothetical protein
MAKSKSGSGSIVKSVESMLPKGISLMHVVLALVLGLMICSFMSDSGVEGFEGAPCKGDTSGDSNNGCEKGTKCYNLKTGDEIKEGETGACATPAHASDYKKRVAAGEGAIGEACFEGSDCTTGNCVKGTCARVAYTGGGAAGTGSSGDTTYKVLDKGAQQSLEGICSAINSKGAQGQARAKFCAGTALASKDACEGEDACTWLDCGSSPDSWESSVYLKGAAHDHLVKCLGNTSELPSLTVLNGKWETNPARLPLWDKYDVDNPDDKNAVEKKKNIDTAAGVNFLKKVECKYKFQTNEVDCSGSKLPGGVMKKVQELANTCAKGWDGKFKELYKSNGWGPNGGPIMSFDSEHGLVCKNPFYDSKEVKVSMPRLIIDETCPDGLCPCDSHADLAFPEGKVDLLKKGQRYVENWTVSPRCLNPTFRKKHPFFDCAPTHLSMFAKDNLDKFNNAISSQLATTGDSCK